ncbi:MAG: hypothetical protein Q4G03_09305 [Planctomycetia bacterium]|nr:hypothetical protein [Planctomycetia bacterium]
MSSTPSFLNLRLSVDFLVKARALTCAVCAALALSHVDNLFAQNNYADYPVARQNAPVVAQYPYGYYVYDADAMTMAPAEASGLYADVQEDTTTLSASEIWSALFFGAKRHNVAKPKFAFSGLFPVDPEKTSDDTNANQAPPQAPNQVQNPTPNLPQNRQRVAQSTRATGVGVPRQRAPQQNLPVVDSDVEIDAPAENTNAQSRTRQARQARLQELDAILAQRRPQEYDQRLGVREEYRNFDVARANRSKIRQTSAEEPQELPVESLPMRPLALQISPSSYVSTRIAPLPPSASLAPTPTKKGQNAIAQTNAQQRRRAQAPGAQQVTVAPQQAPRPEAKPTRLPTYRSDSVKPQPQRNARPTEQHASSEQQDAQWESQDAEPDVEVIPVVEPEQLQVAPDRTPNTSSTIRRSNAQFLDPKTL